MKLLIISLSGMLLCSPLASATQILGTQLDTFVVLSNTGVTNATTDYAPTGSSVLTNTTVLGNLGTTNTTNSGITGFYGAAQSTGPGTVNGSTTATQSGNSAIYQGTQAADPLAFQAQAQLVSAMNTLTNLTPTASYGNLSGLTLAPGVYSLAGVENLGSYQSVTLDAEGNPNATWVFLASSSIVMQTYSTINLTGGALPDNVFWVAASSVTLDTGANMAGNFLASTSITMGANVSLCGRALANTGDVTLISDTLSCGGSTIVDNAAYSSNATPSQPVATVPEPGAFKMLVTGLILLGFLKLAGAPNGRGRRLSRVFGH